MRRASVCFWLLVALAGPPTAWGGVVAFSSDRCPEAYREGCAKSLWTVNDDGSGLARVTPPTHLAPPGEASFDDEPSWSPDGRQLLYRRDLHARAGSHGLWITSLDGASRSQVGPDAPNASFDSYNQPEWSPDGEWVVFSGRPADAPRTMEGGARLAIWLMSIDGAVLRRLTDGLGSDGSPAFSPDGRRIAFIRGRAGASGDEQALLTMDLGGADVAPVFVGTPPGARESTVPGSLRASWSPDGRQFALAYREDLFTLRSDGSEIEWRGRTGSPISIGASFSQVAWSAEPAPALIYSLPMEGRPLQRLDLTGPLGAAEPLTPPVTDPWGPGYSEGDDDPDWRPSGPLPLSLELDPPLVLPIDLAAVGDLVTVSASRQTLSVRKRDLAFVAVDSAGVRRVDVALARKLTRGARRGLCRFAGRAGLGGPRTCSRPAWRRLRAATDFAQLARLLPPARYLLRMRARDGLGNRTARPRVIRLRLRR